MEIWKQPFARTNSPLCEYTSALAEARLSVENLHRPRENMQTQHKMDLRMELATLWSDGANKCTFVPRIDAI